MIPSYHITSWREKAPWPSDDQIEQDLIIERSLVEIFSDDFLRERLAFRGGTALHKLYLKPQIRYSEDIDLVQIKAESFGPTIDRLKERLSFLGEPRRNQKKHNNTLIFRVQGESGSQLRLKVEVNCREHFAIQGFQDYNLKVESEWFKGEAMLKTYTLEELLATKLRALYQRKKGRDLFDLWHASSLAKVDIDTVIDTWQTYMKKEGNSASRKKFTLNVEEKMNDDLFQGDMKSLLRPDSTYKQEHAFDFFMKHYLTKIPE